MRVLFDQGTPKPLRAFLAEHDVRTAFEQGWSELSNGDLLNAAESDGFHVLVSTDKNLQYQQNLSNRIIAVVILPTTGWPEIRQHVDEVADAVNRARPGSYQNVRWK